MPLTPDVDHGFLMSILDTLDRPGQAVRNVLRGDIGGAARQIGQLGADVVDAALPGDWLPNDIAKPEDYVSGGELVGLKEPGIGKTLADIGVGIATDPLSYLTFGTSGAANMLGRTALKAGLPFMKGVAEIPGSAKAIEKLTEAAKTGYQALPQPIKQGAEKAAMGVRSVFGAPHLSPRVANIIATAQAAKSAETEAGISALKSSALASATPEEANIVGDVMDNWKWDPSANKPIGKLGPDSEDPITLLKHHPGVTAENMPRLREMVADAMNIGQQQEKRANIFSKTTPPNPLLFGATTEPQTAFHGDYLGKTYKGQTEEQAIDELLGRRNGKLGNPSAIAERTLENPEDAAAFLGANPGVSYERNAVQRLANRAGQQGTLAQRAEIGKAIMGPQYVHADENMRKAVTDAISEMAKTNPEDAKNLIDNFKGIAPRGAFMSLIAKTNKIFKPAAVYGYAIPKIGSDVRNAISGVWQAMSNPESRGVAVDQLKRLDSTILGSMWDAAGFTYPRDKMKKILTALNDANAQSGGLAENALGILDRAGTPEATKAASIMRSGVLDGFQSIEGMANEMARSPMGKKLKNIADWPGKIFRGIEDRMRAGMYLDLESKVGAQEAARITGDSLYKYPVNSIGNRRARDIIPFFQFQAKAIPQQAKLFAEKPAIPIALASMMSGQNDQNPVYPYMEGRLNIPLGTDAQGAEQYTSGFGLPFESLNNIPTSFRDIKRNLVGSSAPVLKAALSATFGEDPYFETSYGSYDKMPIFGNQGNLGKAYNIAASTGLIQPLEGVLRPIDQILDPRRSAAIKALDMLTGAKVITVDPDVALQQQLQEALKQNPDVSQYRGFYSKAKDEPTQALIRDYSKAKAAVKQKRLEEKAQKEATVTRY